jgi:hypothetical protein
VLGGDYAVTFANPGTVTIHQSATTFTVTTSTAITLESSTCALPIGSVLATFSGTGPSYVSAAYQFNPTTCFPTGAAVSGTASASSDGSVTLSLLTGVHLLEKTADAHPVATPVVPGSYSTKFASAVGVAVHQSGNNFTVTIAGPATLENASCPLPKNAVVATFSGTGPSYVSAAYQFNSSTCIPTGAAVAGTVYVNTDNTITLFAITGWHLLTPA